MKKLFLILSLLLLPAFASATIDQNLYYGLYGNSKVKELQQYLIGKGFLTGNATGNFYSMTLAAVKKYQASKNINTTGYVGPLTRQAINADLLSGSTTTPIAATTSTATTVTPLTGSLSLVQNTSYASQLVAPPQTKFKLADFSLTNNTTEAINLKKIQVDLATGSNLYISNLYVSNLYVTYGNNKTTTLGEVAHSNFWTANYQLPVGKTISLSVYGDINSSIPLNSVINSSLLVVGTSAVSGNSVDTNSSTALAGQNITFGTSSLTVAQDSSTPASKTVAVGQKVVAGKFKFTAAGDSYKISQLKFVLPDSRAVSNISNAILSDETQTLATIKPTYNGKNYIFDFTANIPVALNSSAILSISYDLGATIYSTNTNINVAPILAYIKAVDSKGKLIDGGASDYNNIYVSSGGITLPSNGITVNNLYIYKSIPTITVSSSTANSSNASNLDIYTFNIAADKNGDISVKQLMFAVTISSPNNSYPNLNKFKLFKGNIDYTGLVSVGKTVGTTYIGLESTTGIGIGTNTVIVTFDTEETILAGKNQTYTLKAYVNNFTKSNLGSDSISTVISPDITVSNSGSYLRKSFSGIYGLAPAVTDNSVVSYNLLWSDKSSLFPAHSDIHGSSTNDWYNGFSILNSLSSQTISAQ